MKVTKPIYQCRCDERLKTKDEESTRLAYTGLTYTGLLGELESVCSNQLSYGGTHVLGFCLSSSMFFFK
jgi:hypothetical protein